MNNMNAGEERHLDLLIGIIFAKAKQGKKKEAGALLILAAEMAEVLKIKQVAVTSRGE